MKTIEDIRKEYSNIIVYGVGEYYYRYRDRIIGEICPDFVCDRKFKSNGMTECDGIKTMMPDRIQSIDNPVVIITIEKQWIAKEIQKELETLGIPVIQAPEILGKVGKILRGDMLLGDFPSGVYTDERNNRVVFDKTLSTNLQINLLGRDSKITIAENVVIKSGLRIICGSDSSVEIKSNTEIGDASFLVGDSRIVIGSDCLFSSRIELRCHDSHHIFDAASGKRINYPQDIVIGNQVWIGNGAELLGGASIGDGSVVGTRCVTSSEFGDHVVIAGSPGRIIRENIYWSRDDIQYFNRDSFDECIDQSALKYI